jgi:hypothetical protein
MDKTVQEIKYFPALGRGAHRLHDLPSINPVAAIAQGQAKRRDRIIHSPLLLRLRAAFFHRLFGLPHLIYSHFLLRLRGSQRRITHFSKQISPLYHFFKKQLLNAEGGNLRPGLRFLSTIYF